MEFHTSCFTSTWLLPQHLPQRMLPRLSGWERTLGSAEQRWSLHATQHRGSHADCPGVGDLLPSPAG